MAGFVLGNSSKSLFKLPVWDQKDIFLHFGPANSLDCFLPTGQWSKWIFGSQLLIFRNSQFASMTSGPLLQNWQHCNPSLMQYKKALAIHLHPKASLHAPAINVVWARTYTFWVLTISLRVELAKFRRCPAAKLFDVLFQQVLHQHWTDGVNWQSELIEWTDRVNWQSELTEWTDGVNWQSELTEWTDRVN